MNEKNETWGNCGHDRTPENTKTYYPSALGGGKAKFRCLECARFAVRERMREVRRLAKLAEAAGLGDVQIYVTDTGHPGDLTVIVESRDRSCTYHPLSDSGDCSCSELDGVKCGACVLADHASSAGGVR